MLVDLIQIGNSRGLRLPKAILNQCGFNNTVNIEVEDHSLIITPYKNLRQNWQTAFRSMSTNQSDFVLDINQNPTLDNEDDWKW